jgi:hypothetical protein
MQHPLLKAVGVIVLLILMTKAKCGRKVLLVLATLGILGFGLCLVSAIAMYEWCKDARFRAQARALRRKRKQ